MSTFADLIFETAEAVGADPYDLATMISYETGGTFDPMQAGPTTQWGQHRGLIQLGEPQARQHGADFSSSDAALASQLGADGAVAKYLIASGYQPGMGMMDLYSTVNAGAPGLYNRSDANNGGAPGTVADKVRDQMAGHRRNAERLLGGGGGQPPQASSGSTPDNGNRLRSTTPQRGGIDPDLYLAGYVPPGAGPLPRRGGGAGQPEEPSGNALRRMAPPGDNVNWEAFMSRRRFG